MARIKVQIDRQKLSKLQGNAAKAIELTATEVLTDIRNSQVVPKDVGILERSGHVDKSALQKGRAAVVFSTPYANRLYWHPEYNFRTDKNPNAQGRWMDAYLPDGEKRSFIRNTFVRFVKQLSKGLIK